MALLWVGAIWKAIHWDTPGSLWCRCTPRPKSYPFLTIDQTLIPGVGRSRHRTRSTRKPSSSVRWATAAAARSCATLPATVISCVSERARWQTCSISALSMSCTLWVGSRHLINSIWVSKYVICYDECLPNNRAGRTAWSLRCRCRALCGSIVNRSNGIHANENVTDSVWRLINIQLFLNVVKNPL